MDIQPTQCPQCHMFVIPGSRFCANCGTPLTPQVISVGKQIWIYFVSLALPPLGLTWVFKYMLSKDGQKQRIAIIAAVLTVVSIVLTIWASIGIFNSIQSQLSQFNSLGL